MIDILKDYLVSKGFSHIYVDMMPAAESQRDAAGLFLWSNPRSAVTGETSYYVQIQVRRQEYNAAREDCIQMMSLIDSGQNEKLIHLTNEDSCIGRIRKGPLLLERGAGYTVFYGEMIFWINE